MLNSPLLRCLKRGWPATTALLLTLGCGSGVRAQVAATPSDWKVKSGTLVYLDGERSTKAAIDHLPDAAITSVEGFAVGPAGSTLRQMFGDSVFSDSLATEFLVITTKARANAPATLALADRVHLSSGYVSQPSTVRVIAPKALAYITSHYPKAWLGGEVLALTQKSTGTVKYRVQLADNWGFRYVSFTLAGDFVDDRMY